MAVVRLKAGDILYDSYSKDVGILVCRFDNGPVLREHDFYLWVWEIYWNHEKHSYYSEDAIVNMISSERLLHFGNIKNEKI